MARFLIFETLCLDRAKTLPYVWKKNHTNERHLRLVAPIFSKHSQNVCLINTFWCFDMLDVTASYGTILLLFFLVFSYLFNNHLCGNYCICTKLSQIICLINTHFLIYRQVKTSSPIWLVFEKFQCLKHYIFIKLSQISWNGYIQNFNKSFCRLLLHVMKGKCIQLKSKPMLSFMATFFLIFQPSTPLFRIFSPILAFPCNKFNANSTLKYAKHNVHKLGI